MALGQAFIEVHADTKPFARELGRELNKILEAAESDVRASSRRVGSTIATEVGKGVERSGSRVSQGVDKALTGTLGSGIFARFAKGIVDTIDDGLSGLPAELKVVLGAALVATLPVALALGSGIAGALTAGLLTFGGAAIASVIASQFEEVTEAASDTAASIRDSFLNSVRFFTGPFLAAISDVNMGFRRMRDTLVLIFANAARAVRPVVDSLIGLVEFALPGISDAFMEIDRFMLPLRLGLRLIGDSIGNFFRTIAQNENTDDVLYDLLLTVANLIDILTAAVNVGLNLYGVLIDVGSALGLVGSSSDQMTILARELGVAENATGGFTNAVESTIVPIERQSQEIEEYNALIRDLVTVTRSAISNEIAFQQGLDDLTESLKENGDTLNLHGQEGRDNAQVLLQLADTIRRTRDDTIALTGNVAQAELAFQAQRNEVYRVARQMGLSKTEVDKLIGSLLDIPPPKQAGVTGGSLTRLEAFNEALRDAIYLQQLIDPTFNPRGPGGQQRFADGGIVTGPTNALIGEAGDEVVIPLSRPARAAQLLNESGLSSMMSPTVNVYIGNEQIQAYIAVETNNQLAAAARATTYGTREI